MSRTLRAMALVLLVAACGGEREYSAPREFYSGQALGTLYASLAPFVPEEQSSPYATSASAKFAEAFTNAKLYYEERYATHGDAGLRDYIAAELKRTADQVRRQIKRNVFLSDAALSDAGQAK